MVENIKVISSGVVRNLDDLGRIVIPRVLRDTFGFKAGDSFEVLRSDHGDIVFRKIGQGNKGK